jgi:hypothetical protein
VSITFQRVPRQLLADCLKVDGASLGQLVGRGLARLPASEALAMAQRSH